VKYFFISYSYITFELNKKAYEKSNRILSNNLLNTRC
jgi:hypothetical protein